MPSKLAKKKLKFPKLSPKPVRRNTGRAHLTKTRPSSLPVSKAPPSGRHDLQLKHRPPRNAERRFSSVATPIRDPLNKNQPFPGNRIPADRIAPSSKYLLSLPPAAQRPERILPRHGSRSWKTAWEGTLARVDHLITDRQRIYGRWVVFDNTQQSPDYSPDVVQSNNTRQHNIALNYTYSPAPTWLINLGANYMNSFNTFSSPVVGIENLTQQAGIRGVWALPDGRVLPDSHRCHHRIYGLQRSLG